MLNRRQLLLASATGIALTAQSPPENLNSQSVAGGKRRLNLGLSGVAYYIGFCPFLNWQKMASTPVLNRSAKENISGRAAFDAGYFDPVTGEIANPAPPDLQKADCIFYAAPGGGNLAGGYNFSGMRWTIEWDGSAVCVINGLTRGGSQSINNKRAFGTFTFGENPGNTWTTFTITNRNDPPRNIRIYQSRYTANVAAGETFNPDWLAQIQTFGVLRLMGWMSTNGDATTDFTQVADENYFRWGTGLTETSDFGPKGGAPLSLLCKLANLTRCNIHVNIPHRATDKFVKSFAEHFRDHLDPGIVVTFEYSNECWNFAFEQTRYCLTQGSSIWGTADGARYAKWYGYRSAQCMKIIHDAFLNRSRWRGCLATQTVNTNVTTSALIGISHYRTQNSSNAKPLAISDLFNEIAVTGYFGDVQPSCHLGDVTRSNPAMVTSPGHGYSNGQRLKLFAATGMTELNNTFVIVANSTKDTYELRGVDSTSYKPFARDNRNYAHPAAIFELMDASSKLVATDPRNYPTKYTHFNNVVATSCLNGQEAAFRTNVSVASLREKYWPAQKAIADANGLELTQYEGGLHFVGDAYLSGFGGQPEFNEYLFALGYSVQIGAVYAAMYEAFFKAGGRYPSKFVEGGFSSQFGTWAGLRFIPGDEGNPVWIATRRANEG